jgi:hypothetical protein
MDVRTDGNTASDTSFTVHSQQQPETNTALLYVVLEGERLNARSARFTLSSGDTVRIGRGSSRRASRTDESGTRFLDIRIPDSRMSAPHARLFKAGEAWVVEDLRSKNGMRVNGIHQTRVALKEGDLLQLGHTLLRFSQLRDPELPALSDLDAAEWVDPVAIETLDPVLAHALHAARVAAKANVPILLEGEPGVGRETLARELHRSSGRSGPLQIVRCVTATEEELKQGLSILQPAGDVAVGTLVLDDINELSAANQALLLAALRDQDVVLADGRTTGLGFPVVTTASAPLEPLVESGRFNRALLTRIAAFRMTVPPLRARPSDFGAIFAAVLARVAPPDAKLELSPTAAMALLRYSWPGNIYELEQCLTAMLPLAKDGVLGLDAIPPQVRESYAQQQHVDVTKRLSTEELQHREHLIGLMKQYDGNLAAIARAVGKGRTQVQRWVKRYLLDPNEYRPR